MQQALTTQVLHAMFDDFLDEVNPDFQFGAYSYTTSEVLKTVDPCCYREEFRAWLGNALAEGFIYEHSDGCYYDEPECDE